MSLERDPDRDQPLPIVHDHEVGYPSAHDLACDLLQERKVHGTAKYGTPLQPANGRSFTLDALEEAADLVAYLAGLRWEEEHPSETWLGLLLWSCISGGGYWGELDKIPGLPAPVLKLAQEMAAAVDDDSEVGS